MVTLKGNLVLSGTCPVGELGVFLGVLKRPVDEWEKGLVRWVREEFLSAFSASEPELEYVALGDGTGSENVAARCRQFGLKTVCVDEKGTTMAARDLYWRLHRPAWWQKWLPRSLWVPPRKVDDLAAWAIVLRDVTESAGERKINNKDTIEL